MSKANDFYPGTNERVCLVTGDKEAVTEVRIVFYDGGLDGDDSDDDDDDDNDDGGGNYGDDCDDGHQ